MRNLWRFSKNTNFLSGNNFVFPNVVLTLWGKSNDDSSDRLCLRAERKTYCMYFPLRLGCLSITAYKGWVLTRGKNTIRYKMLIYIQYMSAHLSLKIAVVKCSSAVSLYDIVYSCQPWKISNFCYKKVERRAGRRKLVFAVSQNFKRFFSFSRNCNERMLLIFSILRNVC